MGPPNGALSEFPDSLWKGNSPKFGTHLCMRKKMFSLPLMLVGLWWKGLTRRDLLGGRKERQHVRAGNHDTGCSGPAVHPGFVEGVVSRTGRWARCCLPRRKCFLPCASPWFASEIAHRSAHRSGQRTGRTVEPCTLLTEPLATCPWPDVLGIDHAAGLAVGVVVVDVRVDRMPGASSYLHAPSPPRSSFRENITCSPSAQVNKDKK